MTPLAVGVGQMTGLNEWSVAVAEAEAVLRDEVALCVTMTVSGLGLTGS